ncbi:hypothetical protein SG34_001570 [Thalassomonas viridans]|uniref:Uncharacterized protein n=1 Tax=Thalassomonas viridans TaxID=137584 RepID=A0AAE9Z324_9GAMM|nr:hypothetical protein [Thalassomonas viridans]WDE05658.1 hypothetical protein SG34_001570 [Thalassomonas viridans]
MFAYVKKVNKTKKTANGYGNYLAYLLLSTIFICCLTLGSAALFSSRAYAHALQENTARITLRDGQAEIYLQLDLAHWQATLQDSQAWLTGEISEMMPAKLPPKQQQAFLKNLLSREVRLDINDEKLVLEQITFLPQNRHGDHDFTLIKIVGRHGQSQVEQLKIHFPPSLGAVYTSVIKPRYQMIPAGKTGHIAFPTPQQPSINKTAKPASKSAQAHKHTD